MPKKPLPIDLSDLDLLTGSSEATAEMLSRMKNKEPLLGENGVFTSMLQRVVNSMLHGEVESFLTDQRQDGKVNKRNGHTHKMVQTPIGEITVNTPRDRNAEFEPSLIGKRERTLGSGVDEQILALYAQGNSVEDVRRLLSHLYGLEISSGKISMITDSVLPELEEWRNRVLESVYAVIYIDGIHFKVRTDGRYDDRVFYTVYGIDPYGCRDLLGMYMHPTEGAHHWRLILEDVKKRGVKDVIFFCCDDLSGIREAITDVFPRSVVQKCIVHKVRNSMKLVDIKDYKSVSSDLKAIYGASDRSAAMLALDAFETKWPKYKSVANTWRLQWEELMAFMDYPSDLRKLLYTTNPVEALHRIVRKLIKSKAAWVSEQALLKQLYLSLKFNEKSWKKDTYGWKAISRSLFETYAERLAAYHDQ